MASSAPVTPGQIQGYLNPYTQNVVDTTTNQLQHDNSQQMAQLQGNQIAQGALGGNATGVAKGILAGQQGRTLASTTAGLYQQGYGQALQAAQQQQQTGLAGANATANYGISGQGAALQGAGAQIGAGTLQQQTDQARLNALYGQYAQAQAYPYQQAQWLAGIQTGVGSNLGGTTSSNGTTTGPAPNQTAQYLGLGLSAASLLSDREAKTDIEHIGKMNDGTPFYRYRYKGSDEWHVGPMAQDVEKRNPDAVERGLGGLRYIDLKGATDDAVRRAAGGGVGATPWEGAGGWIPTMQIHGGSGAGSPHAAAPSAPSQPAAQDWSKVASGISGIGKGSGGLDWGGIFKSGGDLSGDAWGGGSFLGGDAYGGSSASPAAGLTADDYGPGYAAGGAVDLMNGDPAWTDPAYNSDRPVIDFNDRAAPVRSGIASGVMDASGLNGVDQKGGPLDFAGTPGMEMANSRSIPLPTSRPDAAGVAAGAPVVASEDDDEEVPAGIAGRPSGPASGGVAPFIPPPETAAARPAQDERSGLGLLPISKNAGTGLLTAGLGMLASRSPFLGNAVGEGGLAGVAAYGSAEEKDRQVAAEAAKLSREANKTAYDRWSGERKQTETERHNKAGEEAGSKLPPLYMRDKNGNIVLAPGAEDATRKLTEARHPPQQGEPLNDVAVQMLADRVRAGDVKALVGLGRGQQGSADLRKIQTRVAEDAAAGKPVNPAAQSILQNAAQQGGLMAAERTQAQIMAKLSVYGRTAFNATDIALEASKAVPRTMFMPVNKIINAAREKTGDPKIVALGQALMTLSNEYARAIGGGHGTVHDKEAAERRLSAAQTQEQLEAVINVMRKEVVSEERAMPAARQQIRDIYNPGVGGPRGNSIEGEHGAPPPPGPVTGASGLPEGRTGTKGGRPVVVKGGRLIYSDTGEPAQ